jgi:GNAT superfamily N-acetyltransferase
MDIRQAIPADKEQVLTLFDEFSKLFHATDVPSEVGGDIFDEVITRKDTKIFVADDNGKLVGLATLYLLPNIRHGWHRGHIEDFYVTPLYQKQGVGTQIFAAIKTYCKQNQIHVIKLDSEIHLLTAHKFYEKNGGTFTEKMFRFDIAAK